MSESAGSVLQEALSPLQLDLLLFIWEPVAHADTWMAEPDWPLWDYVERSLYREHPDVLDAVAVLTSLPAVELNRPHTRPYGLVWHTGNLVDRPTAGDRVGLTVAGLAHLTKIRPAAGLVADRLGALIGALADRDAALTPKPFEQVKASVPLADYTSSLRQRTPEKPFTLPDRVTANIFAREYAPVQIFPIDAPDGHAFELGRASLRAFRGVQDAASYLARIEQDVDSQAPAVEYSSPLTLVQTLDYLGYVLAVDPAWPAGQRLTVAPDLQSAASLSASVTTRHEFESAVSGLWNVISQLHIPDVPGPVLDVKFRGKQPASLTRLQYWLEQRLTDDEARRRALDALTVLRAAGRVRAEPQHGSASVRQGAIEARRRLGLPDIVHDWAAAWLLLCDRLAGAFDTVRREVQAAALPPTDVEDEAS